MDYQKHIRSSFARTKKDKARYRVRISWFWQGSTGRDKVPLCYSNKTS